MRAIILLMLGALLAASCAAPGRGAAGASAPAASAPAVGSAPAAGDAAVAPAAPATLQPLKIGIVSPNETLAVPWVAQDSGIFAKYGFDADITIVTGTPRLVQSLIAGDFEYVLVGVTALMRARMQGADPLILAATSDYLLHKIMVQPRSSIHTLSDLRGKTVGVSQYGSEADTFLRLALAKADIRPEETSILQTGGSPQSSAALVSGNVDAAVMAGNAVLNAQKAGAEVLAGGRELGILAPNGTVGATRHFIERDRAAVQRFVTAYVEAVHYFKTNRDETISIMQRRMGDIPREEAAYLYDEIRDVYQPVPAPSPEAVQAVIDREPDGQGFTPADFLDLSFVQALERDGFIARLYQ